MTNFIRQKSIGVTYTIAVVAIGVALFALLLGVPSLCVVITGLVYYYVYAYWKRTSEQSIWLGNPIRIIIPVFVPAQLAYWLWFGYLKKLLPDSLFDMLIEVYPSQDIAKACAIYLLTHLIFFGAIHFTYTYYCAHFNKQNQIRINSFKLILAATIIIIVSLIYQAAALKLFSQGQIEIVSDYIGTNILRFFPAMIAILVYVLFDNYSIKYKCIFSILLLISFSVGLVVSVFAKMRFVILEQILVACAVFTTLALLKKSKKLFALLLLFASLSFVLFAGLSITKHDLQDTISDDLISTVTYFAFDYAIGRVGSYSSDIVVADASVQKNLFSNHEVNVYRLLGGLPLSGAILGKPESYNITIEQQIYLESKDYKRSLIGDISSNFLSGLTEIRVTYGLFVMIILAIMFGTLNGFVAAYSRKLVSNLQWLIIISTFLLPSLLGFNINNLFRLPVNMLLASVLVYLLKTTKHKTT